jgi:hypothetical protein
MAGQLHLDHTPSGIDPGNHTGQIISEGVAFLARQPGTEGNWLRPEEAIALLGRIASRAPQTWQPPGKRVFTDPQIPLTRPEFRLEKNHRQRQSLSESVHLAFWAPANHISNIAKSCRPSSGRCSRFQRAVGLHCRPGCASSQGVPP